MDRLSLHDILLDITDHVYFQPPESKRLDFPCIVYKRNDVNVKYADNATYMLRKQYIVTVIDLNPDSLIPDAVSKLPNCRFVRFFTKDNLNHDIYNLYY